MKRKLTSYTYVLDHTTQTPACRNSPRSNYCNCNTCQFLSKYFWLVIAAALLMEPVCLETLESYIQTLSIWETHAYVGEFCGSGVVPLRPCTKSVSNIYLLDFLFWSDEAGTCNNISASQFKEIHMSFGISYHLRLLSLIQTI